MNHRQALFSNKLFLSSRRGSNPHPSGERWDALTIELPRLRWQAKVQVRPFTLARHLSLKSNFYLSSPSYVKLVPSRLMWNLHVSSPSESWYLIGYSLSPLIRWLQVWSPSAAEESFFWGKSLTIVHLSFIQDISKFPPFQYIYIAMLFFIDLTILFVIFEVTAVASCCWDERKCIGIE